MPERTQEDLPSEEVMDHIRRHASRYGLASRRGASHEPIRPELLVEVSVFFAVRRNCG